MVRVETRKGGGVLNIHNDLSIKTTHRKLSEIELCKKSNVIWACQKPSNPVYLLIVAKENEFRFNQWIQHLADISKGYL
jgi:hypothetical protein